MLKVTLRSFWEHKRRLVLTIISIVLGVSFMAGTFVLNDSFNRLFDDLFDDGNENVDTQVHGEVLFSDPFGGGDQRALHPGRHRRHGRRRRRRAGGRALRDHVRVRQRATACSTPTASRSVPPRARRRSSRAGSTAAALTPYSVAEGRGPDGRRRDGAQRRRRRGRRLRGRRHGHRGDHPVRATRSTTLVGTVLFGTAKSSAGAVSAEFTLAEASGSPAPTATSSRWWRRPRRASARRSSPSGSRTPLPDDVEAVTGEEAAAELSSDVQEGFAFFSTIILVFGVIALLVGIFVISNTFSIIVQQRTRELALLRAVGASRRQVLSVGDRRGRRRRPDRRRSSASASASCWPRASSRAIGDDFASGVTITRRRRPSRRC